MRTCREIAIASTTLRMLSPSIAVALHLGDYAAHQTILRQFIVAPIAEQLRCLVTA